MLAFAGGALVTPPPVTSSQWAPGIVEASRDSAKEADVDSYGNEVTPAVAEYSLDPAGNPYELHAPQIELPHLALVAGPRELDLYLAADHLVPGQDRAVLEGEGLLVRLDEPSLGGLGRSGGHGDDPASGSQEVPPLRQRAIDAR